MVSKKTRNMIFIVLCVAMIVGGLIYYFNYKISLARQDYEAKIFSLNQQTASNFNAVKNQIGVLGSNLSSQIGLVDVSLQSFKKQNQQQIKTLSDLIDQIEQQSNIKLSELKNELKNIQIKSADFSAIVNDVLHSVVSVKTNLGQGSGAIIDSKGYIVTNVHVINGASAIQVVTYSGDTYTLYEDSKNPYKGNVIVGHDQNADIAVLKIDAPNLKALSFGNSDNLQIGEKVIAAGNPAGLAFTVTEGIVSAFRTGEKGISYIQTDVPINPGNSGGPLINAKGEIVGINNFKISGGFEGLGFAISSNNVNKVVSKIISSYEAKQQKQ